MVAEGELSPLSVVPPKAGLANAVSVRAECKALSVRCWV